MCTDGYSEIAPVGKFKPNGFGLYDMLGNAWEWVEDCWRLDYDNAPQNGEAWVAEDACPQRIVRGGSFDMFPLSGVSARVPSEVARQIQSVGFRVARDLMVND